MQSELECLKFCLKSFPSFCILNKAPHELEITDIIYSTVFDWDSLNTPHWWQFLTHFEWSTISDLLPSRVKMCSVFLFQKDATKAEFLLSSIPRNKILLKFCSVSKVCMCVKSIIATWWRNFCPEYSFQDYFSNVLFEVLVWAPAGTHTVSLDTMPLKKPG